MTPKFYLIVCQNLVREATLAIEREHLSDITLVTFPADFCNSSKPWESLIPFVPHVESPFDRVCIVGGGCLARLADPPAAFQQEQVRRVGPCFHLLIGADRIEQSIQRGAYTLTCGWLAHWQDSIRKWGFDRDQAQEFFKETATRLLLLDTEVDRHSRQDLTEFAEYVEMESEVLPVGLDYFRLYLSKLVSDWRNENERRSASEASDRIQRQLANHTKALELAGELAGILSEEQIAERIVQFLVTLCAPARVAYASVHGNHLEQRWGHPVPGCIPADILQSALTSGEEVEWIGERNALRCRISLHEDILGVLQVEEFVVPEDRPHFLQLVRDVARVCGLAIGHARVYRGLGNAAGESKNQGGDRQALERDSRYLSTHDVLTGLYNRTIFEEELARLEHSRRFPISIVLMDIDNFKRMNEKYGLLAGDRLLQQFAQILEIAFRTEDVVARIGGDEFAVILPGTDAALAAEIEKRVRRIMADQLPQAGFDLSVAIGAATAEKGQWLVEALKLAERRMNENRQQVP
jgi:diguanylate cyclase (GGDEF)-like protein